MLRSEWTKFRTVRGWVIGMIGAVLAIVGFGLLPGMQGSCTEATCVLPVGPEGEEVTDSFYFAHQPLTNDGSIVVRVASMTSVTPWAKAGLIIKESTKPGSAYAAIMVTGGHGVRMQHNYTHDVAAAASGDWLRLTRSGANITGAVSADGTSWTDVGTVRLDGLSATVQVGLFVASPQHTEVTSDSFGVQGAMGGPTEATAVFDHIGGTWLVGAWTGLGIGLAGQQGSLEQSADAITVTGSGDIAPAIAGANGIGVTITQTLLGTFAGLLFVVVIGAMFITAEYRRGLLRTTLAANPRRGRALAAKAIVIGGVTFLVGLVAATIVVNVGQEVLRSNGVYVHPASLMTEVRLVVGTAAMLAVAAVLALAIGVILRRSATAVTAVIVVIVLPYILAMSVLPASAAQWLLRVTPAAAFAVQQTSMRYAHVADLYTPVNGYFPLSPWAGFAVLCAWTAVALGVAAYLLRRRDA